MRMARARHAVMCQWSVSPHLAFRCWGRRRFYGGVTPREITSAKQALIRCDHVVIVYPLGLRIMQAFLKEFLEQLFRRAVA